MAVWLPKDSVESSRNFLELLFATIMATAYCSYLKFRSENFGHFASVESNACAFGHAYRQSGSKISLMNLRLVCLRGWFRSWFASC